jgi:hypothetical protein
MAGATETALAQRKLVDLAQMKAVAEAADKT